MAIGYNWARNFGKSPFGYNIGFESAWQNFMLQDNYRWRKGDSAVVLEPYATEPGSLHTSQSLLKSKLEVWTLKVPITFNVMINRSWSLEAGGFAGYRIESHSKVKINEEGSERKDHEGSNFYLSNFQYGFKGQVRYRSIGLFAEYNMNPLFSPGKGPELRTFQFGIRL